MKKFFVCWAVWLLLVTQGFAQDPAPVAVRTGNASFVLDGQPATLGHVQGDFRQSYGFKTISLTFSKEGKPGSDRLSISLMMQQAGTVDMNQMGNGIGWYEQSGKIFSYVKKKSQCSMTVTKLTADSVEGTAECPVLNNKFGQGTKALTSLKFSASAQ